MVWITRHAWIREIAFPSFRLLAKMNSESLLLCSKSSVTAAYTAYQYYTATFNNADGSLLVAQRVMKNAAVVDPVENGSIPTPSLDSGEEWNYVYKGWDKALSTNMTANATYKAVYKTDRHFTVTLR